MPSPDDGGPVLQYASAEPAQPDRTVPALLTTVGGLWFLAGIGGAFIAVMILLSVPSTQGSVALAITVAMTAIAIVGALALLRPSPRSWNSGYWACVLSMVFVLGLMVALVTAWYATIRPAVKADNDDLDDVRTLVILVLLSVALWLHFGLLWLLSNPAGRAHFGRNAAVSNDVKWLPILIGGVLWLCVSLIGLVSLLA